MLALVLQFAVAISMRSWCVTAGDSNSSAAQHTPHGVLLEFDEVGRVIQYRQSQRKRGPRHPPHNHHQTVQIAQASGAEEIAQSAAGHDEHEQGNPYLDAPPALLQNVSDYNRMIQRAATTKEALEVFEFMKQSQDAQSPRTPNIRTFNALFSSILSAPVSDFGESSMWQLFDEMLARHLAPNVITEQLMNQICDKEQAQHIRDNCRRKVSRLVEPRLLRDRVLEKKRKKQHVRIGKTLNNKSGKKI